MSHTAFRRCAHEGCVLPAAPVYCAKSYGGRGHQTAAQEAQYRAQADARRRRQERAGRMSPLARKMGGLS